MHDFKLLACTPIDEFPNALGIKYILLILVIRNITDTFLNEDLFSLQQIWDSWFALFLYVTGISGF